MLSTPYIGGKALEIPESSLTDVLNPANQKPVAKVFMAEAQHMRAAIDAAEAAKSAWAALVPAAREAILFRAADEMEKARGEIVDLLIDEGGSTFGKAHFEVGFAANMVRSIAGEARRIQGRVFASDVPGLISLAIRRPLGVVAGISPFNFPVVLSLKKVAFALAAGNTFVLKPSEETSLLGLKLAEVFERAGVPAGVFNVVPGDGAAMAQVLFDDPRVKLISFTGSTAVGRIIATECARRGKKFVLEMGGKSPLIVLKDADVAYAVDTACFGLFIHQGQICMAGSRIIVEEPIYDEFLKQFVAKAKTLQVGDPRDPHTVIGPLIRSKQCPMIAQKIKDAVAAGARLLCGGAYQGNFFEPTVVADVRPEMAAFRDELFGPVAAVTKAKDADDALSLANSSHYGLSSAVLTNNMQLAMKFALELEAGMVHLNGPTVHDEATVPFGGVKDSGSGREGGSWSIEEMTEVKWVTIQMGKRQYPF
ncbi:MAG TPA: aldehyde dehydrogenase family protein [Candidatus Acidoferrales bacterium]|nr:aldehyde dehydrogenase family protein [Candidatus Acidoferrales bacterium]